MPQDDRFYAFIVAHTSRSSSRIKRICVERKWLRLFTLLGVIIFGACMFGVYGLTQEAKHFQTQIENFRLKAENERQRQELNELSNRVEAVEDTSRKLAEKSGVAENNSPGAGGPALPLEAETLQLLEEKTARLEKDLVAYEAILRGGETPSIWPVQGKLESGFGGRRNPFGGSSFEFHSGQDIDAPWGAPVVAGGAGKVSFVGWQNGYGQLVVIDHGSGLTTRYGHLSHIDVSLGQTVQRGGLLGKVGSSGRSTGPHLHYEVRHKDEPINPLQYLLMTTR